MSFGTFHENILVVFWTSSLHGHRIKFKGHILDLKAFMNSVGNDTFTYIIPIAQITILQIQSQVITKSVKLSTFLFPCGLIDKDGSTFKAKSKTIFRWQNLEQNRTYTAIRIAFTYVCVHCNYWTMILNCEMATSKAKLE